MAIWQKAGHLESRSILETVDWGWKLPSTTKNTDKDPILSARGLTMRFGAIEVLSDVSLDLFRGEVHAVIGENGAGKSTLMKILAGHLQPSSGQILLDGMPFVAAGPTQTEAAGIVLIHQEILLAPHLTVAQNIFLGREIRRGIAVNDREMNRRSVKALQVLGIEIDPTREVERLSIAQRQLVQIARALSVPHRIVIFDEPSASLTPVETEALFRVINDLRDKGIAVLYISHRLGEVKSIANRVTVLRDGKFVATRDVAEVEPLDMAKLMVGRDMANLYPPRKARILGEVALETKNFSVMGFAENIDFSVRYGEILGFAGLIGAGRTELFEGLIGLRRNTGNVQARQISGRIPTPRAGMDAGIVYLSEDRKGKGLLLAQNLASNLTLAALAKFRKGLFVDRKREMAALETAVQDFDIRTGDLHLQAGQLSGGNQQKLLLAKMMQLEPGIVIVDEPTRGVDIGAKEQIYKFIADLADQGKAVIVISSEMQELIGLCDRILVMRLGRIVGEVKGEDMNEEHIVVLATGAHSLGAAA